MTYWERLLAEYVGGGDSPISPTLIAKSITTNGTYNAVDDEADGYSSVSVNVPSTSTLKGTLPLIFKTSEEQLRDWTIYGNDYEHKYSTSGTLPLTFTTHTAGNASDWSISGNDENGTENLCELTIANCGIDGNGTLTSSTAWQMICAPIVSGEKYTIVSDNIVYGLYASKPEVGSTAYNNTRYAPGGTTRTFTADMTGWIAIRLESSKSDIVMLVEGTTAPDHYIPYQQGVGERTENKMPAPANGVYSANRTTVTVTDGVYHIVQAEGSGSSSVYIDLPEFEVPDNGYIICLNSVGYSSAAFVFRYNGASLSSGYALVPANRIITIGSDYAGKKVNQVQIYTTGNGTMDFTMAPMITDSNTYTAYIPCGYEIPISVNGTPQTFYIGSTPLTAGQSISKTSTGIDIAATAGSNAITTELYNKPEMSIEGVDYVGVGRHISGDRYEIRLECSADVTPYDPNADESNTSYVYNPSTYALDTNYQYKTALIDLPGTGRYTITKTLSSTFKIEELTGPTPWGGIDHYFRNGSPITPSGTSYTSIGSDVDCLLVTYYDDTVDTLTPQEIRESITVSARVHKTSSIEFSGPLTEGETLTPAMIPDRHKYIETISGAVNVLENWDDLHPGYDFGEYAIDITYANMNSTLINKTVNQNGTYVSAYDNANGYNSVAVAVPNTYTNEDENKVVSSGELVAQTTTSVTTNGIVDTTTISSVSVNVPDITYYKNDVTFYDYDGTIIVSYSAAEFAELTELPANPTHTGLISKGWNWTLADAKTFVAAHGFLPIGQCYDPVDDKLRIDIELVPEALSPYLCLGVNGTAVVDWGDGTATDTITGSSTSSACFTPQHTYAAAGKYTITVDITGEARILSTTGTNGACRILTATDTPPSYEQQNAVYKSAVVGVHLCSKVTLQTYAFKNLYSLRYVTLDTTRTSVDRWFDGCLGLTTLIFPPSVTSVGTVGYELSGLCVVSLAKTNSITAANAFNKCYALKELAIPEDTAEMTGVCIDCYSITRANIPSTWTKVKGAIFIGARSLRSVVIPSGATEIESQAFSKCWSLAELDIPDSITTIGTYAFEQCYSLKFIKFHSATPPTVSNSNAFSNLPTTCKIYVPTGSLADYTSAQYYPSSSTYTYVEY